MTISSRVAVTGAAGFIGSHLCDALLAQRCDIVGLDRHSIDYIARDASFRLYKTELSTIDSGELARLLNGCDAVLHLAARGGVPASWAEFPDYVRSNIEVTQRLLATAAMAGVPKLVYVSSSTVYGRMAVGSEDGPFAPVSPYGVTKLAGEHLCRVYAEECGLEVAIIRPFSVYGPRQRPDMVHHIFIRKLLAGDPVTVDGDGSQSRSNTYVSDVVDAIIMAMRHLGQGAYAFNIGGDNCISVKDLLAMLEEIVGVDADERHGPPRPGDQTMTKADTARARNVLGWEPKVALADGLRRQVEWQRRTKS